jgi:hypothetical protein
MRFKYFFEILRSRRIFWFCAVTFFFCALSQSSLAQAVSASDDGLYTSDQAGQGGNFTPRAAPRVTVRISRD